MRLFGLACLFGILVASLGCMTRNWSMPLFGRRAEEPRATRSDDLSIFSSRVMERELFGEDGTKRDQRSTGSAPGPFQRN